MLNNNTTIDNFPRSQSTPMVNPDVMENKVPSNPIPSPSINPTPTVDYVGNVDSAVAKPPSLHSNMFKMQRNKCKGIIFDR